MPLLSRETASAPAGASGNTGLGERRDWRVLLLLTSLSADGGAEVQTVQLALRLKARGWHVSLATLRSPKSMPAALNGSGIQISTAAVGGMGSAPGAFLRLGRLVRDYKPHILHSHMTHAVLAARALRLIHPVPVVIGTLHGLRMYNVAGTGFKARELLYRVTGGLSDLTTVVCRAAAAYYTRSKVVAPERLRVVPNGVDTEVFRPDPVARDRVRREFGVTGKFVWLSIGRLDPIKDHDTLLHAFAALRRRHTAATLWVVGSGCNEDRLHRLAHQLNLDDSVRFLGIRADIPDLMNAADALVLSSKFEALPMVLLEAGGCGLPAVATNVGGNPEVIVDGVTGFLTPVGDAGRLEAAMGGLADLPERERQKIGLAARERILQEYRLDAVVDQWEELYWSLLTARKVRQ